MIGMNTLVGWMFSVVLTLAPPTSPYAKGEDPAERAVRLQSIAEDISEVVFDADEEPLFPGPSGHEKSAVFVATYAAHESGQFFKGVDDGTKRGDSGSSWCIMQMHIGRKKTLEGWTGPEIIQDRRKCVRAGYHVMKIAMKKCKGSEESRMAAYISGSCDKAVGEAKKRYRHAIQVFKTNTLDKFVALHVDEPIDIIGIN